MGVRYRWWGVGRSVQGLRFRLTEPGNPVAEITQPNPEKEKERAREREREREIEKEREQAGW